MGDELEDVRAAVEQALYTFAGRYRQQVDLALDAPQQSLFHHLAPGAFQAGVLLQQTVKIGAGDAQQFGWPHGLNVVFGRVVSDKRGKRSDQRIGITKANDLLVLFDVVENDHRAFEDVVKMLLHLPFAGEEIAALQAAGLLPVPEQCVGFF